jgi:hypothetical protein
MITTPTSHPSRLAVVCAGSLAVMACSDRTPAPPDDRQAEEAAVVSQLEGVWAGSDNKTPLGPMPFGFSFERQVDGALHARTSNQSGFYVEVRLAKEAGRWLMTEEAAIPGRGKQTHTLAAERLTKDLLVFRDVDKPDDLQVRIELPRGAMVFQVMWRGQEHVLFHLNRLDGAAAERARRTLAGGGE